MAVSGSLTILIFPAIDSGIPYAIDPRTIDAFFAPIATLLAYSFSFPRDFHLGMKAVADPRENDSVLMMYSENFRFFKSKIYLDFSDICNLYLDLDYFHNFGKYL